MKRRTRSLRAKAAAKTAKAPKGEKWVTRTKYDDFDRNRSFAPVKHRSAMDKAGAWVSNHKLLVAGGVVAAAYVFMPKAASASVTTTTTSTPTSTTTEVERRTEQGESDGFKIGLGMFAVVAIATIAYMNVGPSAVYATGSR